MAHLKRTDRFEKIVNEFAGPRGQGLTRWEAMDLLRAEHRAVVRLMHQFRLRARKAAFATVRANKCPEWHDAKIEVLNDILAALGRRVQGVAR
jgi:hypothetical protein